MLGAAAIFALCRLALSAPEIAQIHREKMQFHTLFASPALNQMTFLAEVFQCTFFQCFIVTEPDIQIAAACLSNRAHAAHQINAQNLCMAQAARNLHPARHGLQAL